MFEENLKKGKIGESIIANWLKKKGYSVLPVYEIEKDQYAGPAVYMADGTNAVAPDMLIFKKNKAIWIEAKYKNAFTFHRKTKRFTTGIDLNHYKDYQRIMKNSDWPVWLLFFHGKGQAKNSPPGPSGLFGNDLKFLTENENHRHDNGSKYGMVYWAVDKLIKLVET